MRFREHVFKLKTLHQSNANLNKNYRSWATMACTCKTTYLGGRDEEDHGSKLTRANSSGDPISKKSITKKGWWSGSKYRP
jgi:hypothetical protein